MDTLPAGTLSQVPEDAGLAALDRLGQPIWIYDIDGQRMWWANAAAVRLWAASDLDALRKRTFSDQSPAAHQRLQGYVAAFHRGEAVSTRWTFYPTEAAVTADCRCSGMRLPDGHTGMLVEATPVDTAGAAWAATLRGIEALRHTRAMVAMFDETGAVLYQNQATMDAFGHDGEAPSFADRFANRIEGEGVWVQALAGDEAAGRTAFETRHGQRWFSFETRRTRDPATGQPAILSHQVDMTEQRATEDARNTLLEILEATPDFISMADTDRKILYLSAGARRMLDLPPSAPGKLGFDMPNDTGRAGEWVHPEWAARKVSVEGIPTALRNGSWTGSSALVDGQGAEIPVSQVIIAHKDRSGRVSRLSTIMRDIRDEQEARREAEQAVHRLRRVLRVSPAGIYSISLPRHDGERPHLRVLSQEVEVITGHQHDAWSDDPIAFWRSLIHPDDRAAVQARQDDLMRTGRLIHEYRVRHRDGHWLWILDTVAVATDDAGRPVELTGSLLDITARRQMEADLRRSNEDLEQFAYVASHDLQEPLRMVSGYISLLKRRVGPDLAVGTHEFIDRAIDGARRMQGMINDLLRYSRIQSRGAPFAATDSDVALQDALTSLARQITERGGRVDTADLPTVWGDRRQIGRLFQNLISNALKYARPDIPPVITIAAVPEDAMWRFTVADNGIGIAPEHHDRVFNIFQRLSARATDESTEDGGSGIGLAICRRIVDRHGGEIGVTSAEGEGAVFSFTLPAIPADA